MSAEETLKGLEESILESKRVMVELVDEVDKWKRMYEEISVQVPKGKPGQKTVRLSGKKNEQLLEENKKLKLALQKTVHRTEILQKRVNEFLNK